MLCHALSDKRRWLIVTPLLMAGGLAASAALLSPSSAQADSKAAAACPPPMPPSSDFVEQIDNPYFPLKPGTTFVYKGEEDGDPERDVVQVTHDTKTILGVRVTVVNDRVYVKGKLAEQTFDWYAQDKAGNVWYFGEDSKEFDKQGNVVSTEGSWQAGVNGAQPGIIMEANPKVGDTYCQEFAPGVAQDMATVLSLDASAKVPYGSFKHVLKTKEFSPLEPDVVENKFYARGVGDVREVTVEGGDEQLKLVRVRSGDDGEDRDRR